MRHSGNAMQYVTTLFLLDGWPFALLVFARRRGRCCLCPATLAAGLGGAIASLASTASRCGP